MATQKSSDATLANPLTRLWPNRVHESSFLKNLACLAGVHRWVQPRMERLVPRGEKVRFCRWCSKIEVNGVIYEPYSSRIVARML